MSFFVFPAGNTKNGCSTLGDWRASAAMGDKSVHARRARITCVGNMIFLWVFGIIVEGKLGWWAFMLAFLGIGGVESAALSSSAPSDTRAHARRLGAIYGLLAMCMVWAPKTRFTASLSSGCSHRSRSFDPLVRRILHRMDIRRVRLERLHDSRARWLIWAARSWGSVSAIATAQAQTGRLRELGHFRRDGGPTGRIEEDRRRSGDP